MLNKNSKTLAQAIKDGSLPQYNRKMDKKVVRLLTAISTNLPDTQPIARLRKVKGSDLIEDDLESNGDEEINVDEDYTVFENVSTKVNHLKRLKKAWAMSNSPQEVIFYGFKFIPDEYKNEWISIINDAFKTDYPPAYIDDEEEKPLELSKGGVVADIFNENESA
tara:strand:- start:213 stop:707 length:495 start_codon:yes stop_codon:yes gene_type:complete